MRRWSRSAAAASVLLVASLSVAVTPDATEARTVTTYETRTKVRPLPDRVLRYGEEVRISGWVEVRDSNDPACAPGGWCLSPDTEDGTVVVRRTPAGKHTRTKIATLTDEGSFATRTRVKGSARYQVRYTGGWFDEARAHRFRASSATVRVRVSRNLRGQIVERDGEARYIGRVTPGWARKPVTVQRKTCRTCAWRKHTTVRTDRKGRYAVPVTAPAKGSWFWRSTVRATRPRFVAGHGNVWRTFRPPAQ